MTPKDYYAILGIPAGSGPDVVKKAYRRQAMRYHPDRNPGDAYAAAHFGDVQEAYAVLSDPLRREDYLLERGLYRATGAGFGTAVPLTPDSVLHQAVRLDEYVRSLNVYRMDREGVASSILRLLSDAVSLTGMFDEPRVFTQTAHFLARACAPLPLRFILPLRTGLSALASSDTAVLAEIDALFAVKRRESIVSRYQTPILILVTLALCLLAWWLAH